MTEEFEFHEDELNKVNIDGDMFYDLTDGGYIDPHKLLTDPDIALRVRKAADLVQSFLEAIVEAYGDGPEDEEDDE